MDFSGIRSVSNPGLNMSGECKKKLKITCIADLHGHYPELPGGDLLIVAVYLTARDRQIEYKIFDDWLFEQKYKLKVVIAGNHDKKLQCDDPFLDGYLGIEAEYLCDSGTEFEGLKIWGSPYTPEFMIWAFMLTPEQDMTHWDKIPDDVDILITHGPPYGIMDENLDRQSLGSRGLAAQYDRIQPM